MGSTATDDRPLLIGPDSGPEPPFPLRMEGRVISGFGRGSKELGIPTANLPVDASQTPWINDAKSGVYFGWAALRLPPTHPDNHDHTTDRFEVYPMVMSIGYNPFYKNTVRSAEVHVLHKFAADFYGVEMRLLLTGYIREEKDYNGLEALIADIETDCLVARNSLERPGWIPAQKGGQLDDQGWLTRASSEPIIVQQKQKQAAPPPPPPNTTTTTTTRTTTTTTTTTTAVEEST